MANESMRVGEVEIVSLVDARFKAPANAVFPGVSADEWKTADAVVAAEGMVNPTVGCFLVRSAGRTILVDSGIGPAGAGGGFIPPGQMMDQLKSLGVALESIDTVVITHLHVDHVGWNAREEDGKAVPTFPNARYLFGREEYEYWTAPAVLEQHPFLRVQAIGLLDAGRAELYAAETRITDALTLIPTPGHTPGHASIAISSGGEQGFILGDVAHHPAQVTYPHFRAGFDANGELAQQSREALLQRIQELGAKVAAGHFPPPGFGRVVLVEGRRTWQALG